MALERFGVCGCAEWAQCVRKTPMFAWIAESESILGPIQEWIEPYRHYMDLPSIRAGLSLALSLLAALVVRFLFTRVFARIARSTQSDLDDIIIQKLANPVGWSVILLGTWYSCVPLGFSDTVNHLTQGVLATLAILIWCTTSLSIVKLVLERMSVDPENVKFIKPRTVPVFTFLAQSIIFLAAAYFFFLSWEIDITGWLASAGIVGIAVGFAAKDTLANLFAGIFVVADGPYKIGDYLVIENGDRGRVIEIGMRSTRIQTLDNVEVVVPNANIAGGTIMNLSGGSSERTRMAVPVGVAYDSDMDKVRETLLDLAANTKRVLKTPRPVVRVRALQDSSITVTLLVWIAKPEHQDEVLDRLNCEILARFREEGIQIPFPQREVKMLSASDTEV